MDGRQRYYSEYHVPKENHRTVISATGKTTLRAREKPNEFLGTYEICFSLLLPLLSG